MAGSALGLDKGNPLPLISPEEMAMLRSGMDGALTPTMSPQEISNALLRRLIEQQQGALPALAPMRPELVGPLAKNIKGLNPNIGSLPVNQSAQVIEPYLKEARAGLPQYQMGLEDYALPVAYGAGGLGGALLYALTNRGNQ